MRFWRGEGEKSRFSHGTFKNQEIEEMKWNFRNWNWLRKRQGLKPKNLDPMAHNLPGVVFWKKNHPLGRFMIRPGGSFPRAKLYSVPEIQPEAQVGSILGLRLDENFRFIRCPIQVIQNSFSSYRQDGSNSAVHFSRFCGTQHKKTKTCRIHSETLKNLNKIF